MAIHWAYWNTSHFSPSALHAVDCHYCHQLTHIAHTAQARGCNKPFPLITSV